MNTSNSSNELQEKALRNKKGVVEKRDMAFVLKLSYEKWKKIKPVETEYYRKLENNWNKETRTYLVLAPGVWTNVIAQELYKKNPKMQCTFAFERSKVSVNLNQLYYACEMHDFTIKQN